MTNPKQMTRRALAKYRKAYRQWSAGKLTLAKLCEAYDAFCVARGRERSVKPDETHLVESAAHGCGF